MAPPRFAPPSFLAVPAALLAALLAALTALAAPAAGQEAGAGEAEAKLATVLVYHRFGEDHIPSTNTTLADFETHLRVLEDGGWQVVPLEALVQAHRGGTPLPEKAAVITVDDAYRSVYEEAWPRLARRGLPFTLFVATEPIEQGLGGYLSWEELREMAADPLVTLALHSHAHAHMTNLAPSERAADLDRADALFAEHLGLAPALFAYPYGEYSLAFAAELEARGLEAAAAQHSGPVGASSPLFALPRFALSGAHTSVDRLRLALAAQPLPVRDISPAGPVLDPARNPPEVRFTLAPSAGPLDALTCYLAGARAAHELQGPDKREVRIRPSHPLPLGRNRLNCTLPLGGGRWGWFGMLLYYPGNDD